ncbi:MAG: glycoside hydrolase family 6 protein [Pseudonocardiales bacterium]|nr:glycoside hydrolase family 6 protein [Pseudonocardiales bacterium]
MKAGAEQRSTATLLALPGLLALTVLCLVVLSCGTGQTPTNPSNPLRGLRFYVDPTSPAANQIRQWERAGRVADAEALRRIAEEPIALWVTGDPVAVEQQVRDRMAAAAAQQTTPILVAYNIPGRDCGKYSAGGAPDAATYRTWMANLIRGLGDGRAVVILEPDAVSHMIAGDCLSGAQEQERYALLRESVRTLRAKPKTTVYLDAGNPSWITDTTAVADALQRAGGREATGFALNVANFNTTDATVAYGRAVASALGGAHFVIDTSRNGAGRYPDPQVNGAPSWCNPPGRALGQPPTTQTGRHDVDAFLWIKGPGDSDGSCRPGEPAAGRWWPDYALALAR